MEATAAASAVAGAGVAAAVVAASQVQPRSTPVAVAAAVGGLGGFHLWRAWPGRHEPFVHAVRLIDEVHAKQPQQESLNERGHGLKVEEWAAKLCGGLEFVSPALRLAARSQNIERHAIPRANFPSGQQGYAAWCAAVKRWQMQRIVEILSVTGLEGHVVKRASLLIGKELPVNDPEMRTLEDATCLAFLADQLSTLEKNKDAAQLVNIIQKTWTTMSRQAHAQAIGLEYSPHILGCLLEAIVEAEGLGPEAEPMVAPRLPSGTVTLLRKSWAQIPKDTFGQAFVERLINEDASLKEVFGYAVARPSNVTKIVQVLLDHLDFELVPRFERMVHAIAALSWKFGTFRMAHMAPIKRALVRTVAAATPSSKSMKSQVWEAFFYAMAAVAGPVLVMGSNLSELSDAAAATLPSPGGGPVVGTVAAHGTALLEMSLGMSGRTPASAVPEEIMAKLLVARRWFLTSVRDMTSSYCGLVSSVYGRGLDGQATPDASLSEVEYKRWLQRATEVPLRVAELATTSAMACLSCKQKIKPGLKSDWMAGVRLLQTARAMSLQTVEINMQYGKRATKDIEDRLLRLQETEPPWDEICGV